MLYFFYFLSVLSGLLLHAGPASQPRMLNLLRYELAMPPAELYWLDTVSMFTLALSATLEAIALILFAKSPDEPRTF